MQTEIPYAKEAANYRKFLFFLQNYHQYRRQYPNNTLLFSVGSFYIAIGTDAQRIIGNARAESGDMPLCPDAIPDPLIIERTELYRFIGIMSETSFPIKIFYDAVVSC